MNGLPEVQVVLAEKFGGVPINLVNLTKWRQGGFREWHGRREILAQAAEIGKAGEPSDLERFAAVLLETVAGRYAVLLRYWDGRPDKELEYKARSMRGLLRDVAVILKTARQQKKAAKVN